MLSTTDHAITHNEDWTGSRSCGERSEGRGGRVRSVRSWNRTISSIRCGWDALVSHHLREEKINMLEQVLFCVVLRLVTPEPMLGGVKGVEQVAENDLE